MGWCISTTWNCREKKKEGVKGSKKKGKGKDYGQQGKSLKRFGGPGRGYDRPAPVAVRVITASPPPTDAITNLLAGT